MAHKKFNFTILAKNENGYIGVCECCREFNFAYKTFLLVFQEDEMHRFFDWIISKRNSVEHQATLHHGRDRIFCSPNSNLFLTFSDEELEEISNLYYQSNLQLQAHMLLFSNRMN